MGNQTINLPELDQFSKQALLSKKDKLVFLHENQPVLRSCPNCQGMGVVIFVVCNPTGHKTADFTKPNTNYNDAWHEIEETLSFPCLVCSGENYRDNRMKYLWSKSGLEEIEQSWRVSYIDGMEGKTIAHRLGTELLAQIPNINGFYSLYGDYGRGKSGLLKAIVAQSILANIPARYTTAGEILQDLRDVYHNNGSELDYVKSLDTYQVLAIDEIDVINTTAWSETTLRALIDSRYNKRAIMCTLFASNLPPKNLPGYLQSRLDDGWRIPVGGESLRGRQ